VTLTGNIQDALTVAYSTADGSAVAGIDYTAANASVTFPAGSVSGDTQLINIEILDESIIEPTEIFTVILGEITFNGSATLDVDTGIGTILDDDGGEGTGLFINDITIDESGGTAILSVTLMGDVQGGFSVDYITTDNSALLSEDYLLSSGTLSFIGNSDEIQTIEVSIIDDDVIETTESLFVILSNLSTDLIGIVDGDGEVTIIDSDIEVLNDEELTIDDLPVDINILANDSFGADDIVTNVILTNPINGTVSIDSNNVVTYTPNNGYFGIDTFEYTVTVTNTDGSMNSATATVTITVYASPIAEDDLAETEANIPVEIDILANDSDSDGTIDSGTVTIINPPLNGTVFINSDGSVTYTPALDFIGDDFFTYKVCDNDGLCDTAEVTVISAGVLAAELVIPEGFSPNGDGVHELFDVEGLANLYPNFKMVIYNRWGVLVYDYTHNGNPASEPLWWDGYSEGRMTMGNKPVPVGTYFYTLYFNKDSARSRAGWLYLNR